MYIFSHFNLFLFPAWQLIQCRADPNTANEHGNTPLHYACFWGQDEVAEVYQNTHTHTHTHTRPRVFFCCPKTPSSGEKRSLQLYSAPFLTSNASNIWPVYSEGLSGQWCTGVYMQQIWTDASGQGQASLKTTASRWEKTCGHVNATFLCILKPFWKKCWYICLSCIEKAEKMGQNMTKVPYKETFWKGTMRTRPSE